MLAASRFRRPLLSLGRCCQLTMSGYACHSYRATGRHRSRAAFLLERIRHRTRLCRGLVSSPRADDTSTAAGMASPRYLDLLQKPAAGRSLCVSLDLALTDRWGELLPRCQPAGLLAIFYDRRAYCMRMMLLLSREGRFYHAMPASATPAAGASRHFAPLAGQGHAHSRDGSSKRRLAMSIRRGRAAAHLAARSLSTPSLIA